MFFNFILLYLYTLVDVPGGLFWVSGHSLNLCLNNTNLLKRMPSKNKYDEYRLFVLILSTLFR